MVTRNYGRQYREGDRELWEAIRGGNREVWEAIQGGGTGKYGWKFHLWFMLS